MIWPKGLIFLYFLVAIPGNNGNGSTNSPAEVTMVGDESNNSDLAEEIRCDNDDESTNSPAEGPRTLSDAELYNACADLTTQTFNYNDGIENYAIAHRYDSINSSAGENQTESTKSETVTIIPGSSGNDHINSATGGNPTITDESTESETLTNDLDLYRLYLETAIVDVFDNVSDWCSNKYSDALVEVCTTKLRGKYPNGTGLQIFVKLINELIDLRQSGAITDDDLKEMYHKPSDETAQEAPKDDVQLYESYLIYETNKLEYIQNAPNWCKNKYNIIDAEEDV